MRKSIFALLVVGAMFVGVTPIFAQDVDYKNSPDPLVRCLGEARRIAPDPNQYPTPDCAIQSLDGNVVTFPEVLFKKQEAGMVEWFEWVEVQQYFRDWLEVKDLTEEYKRFADNFSMTNRDYVAETPYHRVSSERKSAGIGDYSSLILRKGWADVIHIGTGANDTDFTEGKEPIWIFDRGGVDLLVFSGYCSVRLRGKVFDTMSNEFWDPENEFFRNHHVAVFREGPNTYKVINEGDTEHTFDVIYNPIMEMARKTVGRIAGVCGSKNVQIEVGVEEEMEVEALVGEVPSESDLAISENAKKLNDELKALFGDLPVGDKEIKPKVPELTGNTPYFFDNPLLTKDNRYFSFTANAKNHIIEYRGGNKITMEFPDGTTFVPESGDFVRVPVGTKVKTEMGLYQGDSQYDNVGKFGMSNLGITNVAGGSSITLGGGSVVELVPTESGASSNVKLNNGEIRIGTGGFGGTDSPDLPTEIQFEGRQDVEISWDGTDFAVSYDRGSGKIIAEIYDGTIKVAAGEKTYPLSSSYGGEIKRIEIGMNGEVIEKTAVPGVVWREKSRGEPKKAVGVEVESSDKRPWRWVLLVVGVVGLAVAGGVLYRKRFGTWPLEARWKLVINKLMKIILTLVVVFFFLLATAVKAQEKDGLIACIEEVKQIREKDGPEWFVKNKSSCLGEGAVGKFSVLPLTEFSKKEFFGDMELELFAFFDTPVDGVSVREGQMEYQETSEPKGYGLGYRTEKKMEKPRIGDKSLHQTEMTYVNIAEGYEGLAPAWAGYTTYQELMVIVGNCSFMVGGRSMQGNNWSDNHRVDWTRNVVINSDHDHGEEKVKQEMWEYAKGLVGKISGVCDVFGSEEIGTKNRDVADWTKGLLDRREKTLPEQGEPREVVGNQTWESVKFMTEEMKQKSLEVSRWIEKSLGEWETKKIEKDNLEYELFGRTPQMTDQIIREAQQAWKKSADGVRFFDEKSFPQKWRTTVEDQLKQGAEVVSGDDFTVIFKADGGSILYYPSSFGVYVDESTYNLESGEIEVKTGAAPIDIKTLNAFIKSKGTHYRVLYDPNKQLTTISVYEGEVEITARDGKTMRLAVDGDRPGVAVTRKRLSVPKLVLIGGILVAIIIGSAFLVFKKRNRY